MIISSHAAEFLQKAWESDKDLNIVDLQHMDDYLIIVL